MFSGIYHDLTLYVQNTKNQAIKKWLPFELICAVYIEYIVIKEGGIATRVAKGCVLHTGRPQVAG